MRQHHIISNIRLGAPRLSSATTSGRALRLRAYGVLLTVSDTVTSAGKRAHEARYNSIMAPVCLAIALGATMASTCATGDDDQRKRPAERDRSRFRNALTLIRHGGSRDGRRIAIGLAYFATYLRASAYCTSGRRDAATTGGRCHRCRCIDLLPHCVCCFFARIKCTYTRGRRTRVRRGHFCRGFQRARQPKWGCWWRRNLPGRHDRTFCCAYRGSRGRQCAPGRPTVSLKSHGCV